VTTPDGWWLLRASNTQDVLVAGPRAAMKPAGAAEAQIVDQLKQSGLAEPSFTASALEFPRGSGSPADPTQSTAPLSVAAPQDMAPERAAEIAVTDNEIGNHQHNNTSAGKPWSEIRCRSARRSTIR